MKRIKFINWLKRNRWTITAVADQIGISRQAVHRFCNGGNLKTENRVKLAQLIEKTNSSTGQASETDLKDLSG